jgi:hypothetical protein
MPYLDAAMAALLAAFLGSKVLVSLNRHSKRARVENQLHDFIRQYLQYLSRDATNDTQNFKETKQLLMLDWLDVNARYTRIDFCRYFDALIDRYCESIANTEYLKRREMAAANEAFVLRRRSVG